MPTPRDASGRPYAHPLVRLAWRLPIPWFQELMYWTEALRTEMCGVFYHRWEELNTGGMWHCRRRLCSAFMLVWSHDPEHPEVVRWEIV